jgi:hypothetical protein
MLARKRLGNHGGSRTRVCGGVRLAFPDSTGGLRDMSRALLLMNGWIVKRATVTHTRCLVGWSLVRRSLDLWHGARR